MKKAWKKICVALLTAGLCMNGGDAITGVQAQNVNETEANDERNTANKLEDGNTVLGKMDTEKDNDYYQYMVSKAGYFNFTLSNYNGKQDNIGDGWKLTIYDDVMNVISTVSEIKTSYTTVKYDFRPGTILYLRVENQSEYQSAKEVVYGLSAQATEATDWEQESNNSTETATDISGMTQVYGNTYTSDDIDYYKYQAKASGTLNFSVLNHDGNVDDIGYGWNFIVYDGSMNELLNIGDIKTEYNRDGFTVKKNGVYYIKIANHSEYYPAKGVTYELKPNFKKNGNIEKENNNLKNKANTIKKSISGNLINGDDIDHYKFKAKKSKKYKLIFDTDFELEYGYDINIYDAKGSLVKQIDAAKTDSSVKFKAKKGKKYYITVGHNSSWSYSYCYIYRLKIK